MPARAATSTAMPTRMSRGLSRNGRLAFALPARVRGSLTLVVRALGIPVAANSERRTQNAEPRAVLSSAFLVLTSAVFTPLHSVDLSTHS
jgi:hypothetical protein